MKEFIVLVLIALTPIAFSQQIGPSWQSFYFTLQHNYYEYIPIELPGYETVFVNYPNLTVGASRFIGALAV
ncbi:MAG: hypothetical protein ACP5FU_02850, partial [Nitrososphaeria archaeon]